tara:strand:+ start:661 stop:1545 length:885 start_codon:yes stop_codon:yes gene_type:complete
MKKILITGALGQDGIILSKIFIKNRYSVYGFIKSKHIKKIKSVKYININNKNFEFIESALNKIQPNIILHLGSHNPSFNKNFSKFDYTYNLNLTKKIFNFAKNNNIKIIFPSSSQIFKKSKKKIRENSKINITSYYTKFRWKASSYLLKLKKKYKLNATIIVLFNHDSKYRNKRFLFPRLMSSIKKKKYSFLKKIYIENIVGDFSHAEDICNAIFLLIKKNKNPDKIILCSGKITYINDIIDFFVPKLKHIIAKKPKKKIYFKIGNNLKTVKLLNWKIKKNSLYAAKEIYKIIK